MDIREITEKANKEMLKQTIKDALDDNKTVRFTLAKGIIKEVTKWELNEYGDLIASYSTGYSNSIAFDFDLDLYKIEIL